MHVRAYSMYHIHQPVLVFDSCREAICVTGMPLPLCATSQLSWHVVWA